MARREVATKLVDRTFLVGTLLTLAMIVGFVVVQAFAVRAGDDYDLVATPARAPMADAVAERAPASTTRCASASCRRPTTPPPRPR